MTEIINDQSINVSNPQEVLASCLIKSHNTYLGLIDDGFASDLYRELGKTVRCLAKCLVELGIPYDEFLEEDAADLEPEEETPNPRLHCV